MKPASIAAQARLDALAMPSANAPVVALRSMPPPALLISRLIVPLPQRQLTVRDWQVDAGEKVALIGCNGVGKTSLTEALLGFRRGAIVEGRMLGVDIAQWSRTPALRKRLGVQLQRVAFPGRPRVRELISMHRALYDRTSEDVMNALGVGALSQRLYEFLSRGETQRVDLFLALAHQPELLFLDEPYTGLDPQFSRSLGTLIGDLRNTTVVMCCHTAEELRLATRVAWLRADGIARFEAPDDLRRELLGEFRLMVDCDDDMTVRRIADMVTREHKTACPMLIEGSRITLAGGAYLRELARALVDWPGVCAVEVGHSTLADLLRHCAREA